MIDLGFLTFDGEPRTMVQPVQVSTTAEMTPDQSAAVEQAYRQFCASARLSLAFQHLDHFSLPDGTQITCERIGMEDKILVEPAPPPAGRDVVAPLAYPAFVSLEYAPVYERQVIDLGTYPPPQLPPEPVWSPTPYNVPPPDPNNYGSNDLICFWPEYRQVGTGEFISWQLARFKYSTSYQNADNVYVLIRLGGVRPQYYSVDQNDFVSNGYYNGNTARVPEGTFPGTTFLEYNGNLTEAQIDKAVRDIEQPWWVAHNAANDAASAQYNADYAAWQAAEMAYISAQYQSYLAAHAAWKAECDAILAQYPSKSEDILTPIRVAARPAQLAALAAWLDTGIGLPHLTARYLSLPYNVSYAHTASLDLSGGFVAGANQVTEYPAAYRITYSVTNATKASGYSETYSDGYAHAQMVLQDGWSFGGDVAHPQNLFGWRANGQYSRLSQWFPYNYFERPQTVPGDLSSLTFDTVPGYAAFMGSPIQQSAAVGLKPSSDAFVPPGTVATLIQLEYETFDPITREWLWMPHVGMISVDAIWLSSLGQYQVPVRPTSQSQGVSPRAVRVRRVLRQKRNSDLSWTSPTDVPPNEMREAAFPSFPLTALWPHYPSTIVALLGLPPYAAPKPVHESSFPFGAGAVFAGMDGDFRGLLTSEWSSNQSVQALAARALRHVYRVI